MDSALPGRGDRWARNGQEQVQRAFAASLARTRPSGFLPPVAEIVVARALHAGLCAREPYVGAKAIGEREVRAANQQEAKLRLTQLLVKLCVPTSSDIDLIGISRLRAHHVVDGVAFGERGKRRRHVVSDVSGFSR